MSRQARYNTSSAYTGPTSGQGRTTERTPSFSYSKPPSALVTTYVPVTSSRPTKSPVIDTEAAIPSTLWSPTTLSETTSASATLPWSSSTPLPSDLVSAPFPAAAPSLTDTSAASALPPTLWPTWPSESPAVVFLSTVSLPDTIPSGHSHSDFRDAPSSTRGLQTTEWPLWSSPSLISTFINTISYPSTIRPTSILATVASSEPVDPNDEYQSPLPTTYIPDTSSAAETPGDWDVISTLSQHTADTPDTTPFSSTQSDGFPNLFADMSTTAADHSSLASQTAAPSTRDIDPTSSTSFIHSIEESQYSSTATTTQAYTSRSYITTLSPWTTRPDSRTSRLTVSTSRSSEQSTVTPTITTTDSESPISQATGSLQPPTSSAMPTSGGGQAQFLDDTANSSTVMKRSAEISGGAVGAALCILIGVFLWIRRVRRRGTIYVGMQQRQPGTSRFSFDT